MLALQTWYGMFRPTVQQFGTLNTVADWDGYSNDTIWQVLNDIVLTVLENGLVYCHSDEVEVRYLNCILKKLCKDSLYLVLEMCNFYINTI